MKRIYLLFFAAVLLISGCASNNISGNQEQKPVGYIITSDSIIFMFDASQYKYVTNQYTGEWVSIKKIPIRTVTLAGDFNSWSRSKNPMENDNGIYKLTFPLTDFQENKPYQFKFVLNEQWWVEPSPNMNDKYKTNLGNHSKNLSFIIQEN
uniref:Glycoside hydrolase family 13 N-terminal domain-containing protein n=1 Tax=Gracilinema caldarium TaxID=215591 RepID=A0A7C3HZ59_9SPIR